MQHLMDNSSAPQQEQLEAPVILHRRHPKTSVVYGSYWTFASRRQLIYYRRLRREPPPWTDDRVIAGHRFTNAFRASDRVSQYLIRNVIYDQIERTPADYFLRIMLFKLFNRTDTWSFLVSQFGDINALSFEPERFSKALDNAMGRGRRVYSAAYIMPSARQFGPGRKHRGHLMLLDQMLKDELPVRLQNAPNLRAAYELLLAYQGLGPFLAFQYIIDLNYSPLMNFDEMDFVVAGPGARDGLAKCFTDNAGYSPEDLIVWVCDRQQAEFETRGLPFSGLFGRPLQLIDCQNLFCEVDKYARKLHPTFVGQTKRTRIKQKYSPHPFDVLPRAFFPPSWNLDEAVSAFYDDGA